MFYVRIESFDCTREVKSMANIKSAIKRAKLSEERRA
ncbi:30S ribosomal protein S20, partial [Xenorhabdus sp. psl]|nr:30S ribosomal protein S20 [Xenorhabdus sp. psl]